MTHTVNKLLLKIYKSVPGVYLSHMRQVIIEFHTIQNSNTYLILTYKFISSLRWRHNGRDSVSNHQPHGCLLNRLFRRRSKKTSKLRVTGLCAGNSPGTGEFPAQWPVTRKMFPFDDVIDVNRAVNSNGVRGISS